MDAVNTTYALNVPAKDHGEIKLQNQEAKHANTRKEFACHTHPMLDPGAIAEVCIFYDNGDRISVCNTSGLHDAAACCTILCRCVPSSTKRTAGTARSLPIVLDVMLGYIDVCRLHRCCSAISLIFDYVEDNR